MTTLFLDACIDGKVALSHYRGEEVAHNRLPATEWDDAQGSSSAKYYRVRSPRPGYLVMADYSPPTRDGQTRLCMLNIDSRLDFNVEIAVVQQSLFGKSSPPNRQAESYQIVLPDQQVMITLYPQQMFVKFLNSKALEKLPKTITAGFGAPYIIH
jgi:hypothetical protein